MSPNLFVAARTLVQPQKWIRKASPPCKIKHTEEWSYPIPGKYRHTTQGWFLVATKSAESDTYDALEPSAYRRVIYWHVKHRYEFQDVLEQRTRSGFIEGKKDQKSALRFYCMPDDGATWIQCWDKGEDPPESVPGPYRRYILDAETRKFRAMTKGDERYIRRQSSRSSSPSPNPSTTNLESLAGSLHPSRATTPVGSRRASMELLEPQMPQEKRNSLVVPDARPKSIHSRSRSASPSPLSTPVKEEDLKMLEAKIVKESSPSDARHGRSSSTSSG